jgi:hypothetical protein
MLIAPEDECRSILQVHLMKNKIFERNILKYTTLEKRLASIKTLISYTQAVINRINTLTSYLPTGELKDKIGLSIPILQMNVVMMIRNLNMLDNGDYQ